MSRENESRVRPPRASALLLAPLPTALAAVMDPAEVQINVKGALTAQLTFCGDATVADLKKQIAACLENCNPDDLKLLAGGVRLQARHVKNITCLICAPTIKMLCMPN